MPDTKVQLAMVKPVQCVECGSWVRLWWIRCKACKDICCSWCLKAHIMKCKETEND